MRRQPNVGDIQKLSERYDIAADVLEEHLMRLEQDGRISAPHSFQGVNVWFFAETDGWFLRHEREQAGVLQAELADEWGVSASTISSYENGNRDIPSRLLTDLRQTLAQLRCVDDAA